MSDEVVDFEAFVSRKRQGDCLHMKQGVLVSETGEASVTCKTCKAALDPYWVLRQIARDHDALEWRLKTARAELKRLGDAIDTMKKERHSLMGKVRRLKVRLVP